MTGLIARALSLIGYDVETASALRSYEGMGDEAQQRAIADCASEEAARLIAVHRRAPPRVWLTYMNYYKSPDHLGPRVARALGVPYIIIETSYAPKRAEGPFAFAHAAAFEALSSADGVIVMTAHDEICLNQVVAGKLHQLFPFIDTMRFPARRSPPSARMAVILSTAMLRPGKKLANFPLIAEALSRIADLNWTYIVAGDGPGRDEAMAHFTRFPRERVSFAGRFPAEAMSALYQRADVYLWPGLREAYGLSYLEAQASGVPVVACDTHGVPAVVQHGRGGFLSPAHDAGALAQSLRILLSNRATSETMGAVAAEYVHGERTIAAAAARLKVIFGGIGL